MPIFRRPRPVLAVLLSYLVLGAAACATPPPATPPPATPPPATQQPATPQAAVSPDPCELFVFDIYEDDALLEPPYEVNMIFRPSGDEARIMIMGTGWGPTRFSMTGPGKAIDTTIDEEHMNPGPGSWSIPHAGTWHFRMTDGRCTREFDVEVNPKV